MDGGRRRMYALTAGVAPPPYAPPIVATCSRFAVARLWSLLADFTALRQIPIRWRRHCRAGHPFIYYDTDSASFAVDRPAVAPPAPPQ